jgi:tRNA(fMet)-specific endonuclease VapC
LQQTVAISALTRAELRFGQAGMAADDRRRSLIDHFLLQLPNLPWTHQAADRYGPLKDAHRRSGTPIGEIHTQIAAYALAEGLKLVTHNTRHFDQVPGLQIADWMAEPPAPARRMARSTAKTRPKQTWVRAGAGRKRHCGTASPARGAGRRAHRRRAGPLARTPGRDDHAERAVHAP